MIDFAKLEAATKANRRSSVPTTSDFVWRFRRFEQSRGGETKENTQFIIGKDMWNTLGFSNMGLMWYRDNETNTTYIQVVPEKNALALRGTGKGEKKQVFKAEVLEEYLISGNLIPATGLCDVKLDYRKANIKGTNFVLYEVVSGEFHSSVENSDVDEYELGVEEPMAENVEETTE